MLKYFIFLVLIISLLSAREIKIVKILDSNLFKTDDSLLISMVDLEVPPLTDQDSSRSDLAKNAVILAKLQLLNQKLRFEKTSRNSCSEKSIIKGHLFRLYPFNEVNINEMFLEKGFAVYSPCDTLYMDKYREANLSAMHNRKGIWASGSERRQPDLFNRLRISFWIINVHIEKDTFVPPLFGLNYRWSDLFTMIEKGAFNLNASIEAGTLIYFFLPYANFGAEARFKKIYARAHYDSLLPFVTFHDDDEFDAINFWGFDVGLIIQVKKNLGIEIEYNIKRNNDNIINYITINFTSF